MVRLGRGAVALFLVVLCAAAVSPGRFFPSDCRAMQRMDGGTHWIQCAVVNCTDNDPCVWSSTWFMGEMWLTCACQQAGSPDLPCATYWAMNGYPVPPTVICYNSGCPILQSCSQNAISSVWQDVCECGTFDPN